jgi:hypothetical protein
MKKTIWASLLFLFICTGSVLFFSSFKNSSHNNNLLVVQIFEVHTSTSPTSNPSIIISDGTKIIKTVELESTKGKGVESNLLKIATEFNELKNNGYSITASNSVGTNFYQTTYVFEKK